MKTEERLNRIRNNFLASSSLLNVLSCKINQEILIILLENCKNCGNLRHTFKDFEKSIIGNNIVSKLALKYPIKTGIDKSINKTINWLKKI